MFLAFLLNLLDHFDRKIETLPASAMMGIFGAEAHTDLAVAAISGGLKRQKKTNKTTVQEINKRTAKRQKKKKWRTLANRNLVFPIEKRRERNRR